MIALPTEGRPVTPMPLLLEYSHEEEERYRQEKMYTEGVSRAYRWCLAPLIFVGTMVPASALLIHILRSQNNQASTIQHGITLIPTLSLGVDIMGIGVVLVSIVGLLGVAKGCRRLMHLYFGFVLCFISVQVAFAVASYFSGSGWVHDALERSWEKAYRTDKTLIQDLQTEFNCQGFNSRYDRYVPMTPISSYELPTCAQILEIRFGSRLQKLGSLILCIRLIQLTGVFLLSILFKHLTILDEEESEQGEQDAKLMADEERPYFLTEKQLEDEKSRMPLLYNEDDQEDEEYLPHYSEQQSDANDDEEDDGEADDQFQSSADCQYRNLPGYEEEEQQCHRVYIV